jgi:phospholipid:diacylglycerol acyltransferase
MKLIHAQFSLFLDYHEISMKIPGIDLTSVEAEWQRLRSSIPEVWKLANDGREFQVGDELKAKGLTARYPVVLVPGIVSTVCYYHVLSNSHD